MRRATPVLFAFVVACASNVTPPAAAPKPAPAASTATPTLAATMTTSSTPFDPVLVGQTPDGVRKLCDDHLARARAIVEEIKAKKGAPAEQLTYASTLGRFDDAVAEISNAGQFPYLMSQAHPDKAVREAARECDPKVDAVQTGIYLDADLASVLKAFAGGKEAAALGGEQAKLLHDVLRDFRRNGLDLPADKQKQLRELNAHITEIEQKFQQNIAQSGGKIALDPKQLDGLPPEYVAKHPKGEGGKVEITTDYPDFFPFVTYAKDRKAAKDLYVQFTNRGGDENVKLLQQLLELRWDKAKLLGYETWADYQAEPRMAKSAKTVREFLSHVADAVKEPAKAEFADFMKEHVALGGKATDALPPSDRYFLEDRVKNKKFKLDTKELASYFEVGAVTKGLLDLTSQMYGLEFREVPAQAWHEDVKAYEVVSEGKTIAKFYLDLYPRADKFKHAAMFSVRQGKRLPDGTYQTPMAALECNFPRPAKAGEPPAVMEHSDVVTFFHEFGHVLHHVLTRSELATYSGANTVRDFVEAPSQMFEEWAYDRAVLDRFARHRTTGAKIPDALFAAMKSARALGRGLATQRQLFLAQLDYTLHSRDPRGAGFDTTAIVAEVQKASDPFAFVPGTHFQSSFGHLVGYDAGYYGYQWALSLSRDVLTRFKKEGLLNVATARAWRDDVLAKGGGQDEAVSVTTFLGRAPNEEAYVAYLKGHD